MQVRERQGNLENIRIILWVREVKNLLYDAHTGRDTDRKIVGQATYHSLIRRSSFLGRKDRQDKFWHKSLISLIFGNSSISE